MSYDASITLETETIGNREFSLEAGSYNPGNQPSYGSDWEYYEVFLHNKTTGNLIQKWTFHSESEARKKYNSIRNSLRDYAPKPNNGSLSVREKITKVLRERAMTEQQLQIALAVRGNSNKQYVGNELRDLLRKGKVVRAQTINPRTNRVIYIYRAKA